MEETAILKTKSILLREKHERQEGIDEGILITGKINSRNILERIDWVIKNEIKFTIPRSYNRQNFSEIAIKAIYSYLDYVDNYIWYKEK